MAASRRRLVGNRTGMLYRLKAWIEHFAAKPYALWVLGVIACIEASVFPVPPDVLLIALSVAASRRSFLYAAICVAGSTLGALLGYFIGYAFFELIGRHLIEWYGMQTKFDVLLAAYRDHAWVTILFAGFTSIPFSIFTIAAGFNGTIVMSTFVMATLAGRSLRFFLVGALLFFFGPAIKTYLDKYLGWVSLACGLLFILGFLILPRFL